MTLFLEPNDNLFSVINKIKNCPEENISLPVSAAFLWTQNRLNLKLLLREAKILKKNLIFTPQDAVSEELVAGFREAASIAPSAFGFIPGKDIAEPQEKVKTTFPKIFTLPKLPQLPKFLPPSLRLPWLFVGVFILLAIGGLTIFLLNYIPRATVTLTVSSESLVKSIEVEASTSAEKADVKQRIIPAVVISASAKGKGEGEATGKKEAGEKALGKVTIYNKTEASRNIRKGTVLRRIAVESGGDLAFSLSSDISVPARSSVITPQPGFVFGQAEASVSAVVLGPAGNLTPNQTFSIGDLSTADFIAQNKESFSGGAVRLVKVITKDDQQKILEALSQDLEEKLKADLRSRLVGDQKLEEGALVATTVKKTFDKNVGDEADKFNLELEKQASALAYSPQALDELLGEILKDLVPVNYELYSQDKSVSVTGVRTEGGVLKFTAKVKGYIVPRLDTAKIQEDLAGQGFAEANSYLTSLPGIDAARLEVFPVLKFWQKVPGIKDHITIVVDRK
ncbi:MAG: hypothetical protein AAB486_02485 [Patescibacteria group bacterium]